MRNLAKLIHDVEGWCTLHKAQTLYELASDKDCSLAVEIGIFGGKSLLPVAAAFADKGRGEIYGIEPWDNAVAIETPTDENNDTWWGKVDLVGVKRSFLGQVLKLGLEKHVKILEIPSDAAVPIFQTPRFAGKIDLVHVDGAHSVEQSVFDCAYWLRLLNSGRHLVLDDINWPSVQPALDYMKRSSDLIYISEAEEKGWFAVFRKR